MNKYFEKSMFLIFFGLLLILLSLVLGGTLDIVNTSNYGNPSSRSLGISFRSYLFFFVGSGLFILGVANFVKYIIERRK